MTFACPAPSEVGPRGGRKCSCEIRGITRQESSRGHWPMKAVIEAFEELEALPVNVAILDASGTIVSVNDAWKDFGRRNGLCIPNSGVSSNYLQYCETGEPQSSWFIGDLRKLLAGRLELLTLVYPCHSASKKRWFCMIGLPLSLDEPAGVALLHVNLTDMLALPIAARAMPLAANRRKQVHTTARLEKISGAVERSVSETLSSQLNAMLTGPARSSARHRISAHRESEQILANARLSKRQMQVLRLLGKGKTNKEIADALFRSPNTVKLHVSSILRRLKLKSRTQAALLASRLNKEESIDVEDDTRTWKKTAAPVKQRTRNGSPLPPGDPTTWLR
jgi:DNA-binding CsgD family transcriptional regulator